MAVLALGRADVIAHQLALGIGHRAEAQAAGSRGGELTVNKRNVLPIRAYERFGFRRAEAVVKEIGGGFVMDDYRMTLAL